MPSQPPAKTTDRLAEHWRRLSLLPGAPECVINAAHRYHIEIHHPDRGGNVDDARRVNVARDELRGHGTSPNEHVARHFRGEPWHVLGLSASADRALAERAAKALASDLAALPRLASRVAWAAEHWVEGTAVAPRAAAPPPPPPRAAQRQRPARSEPATAGPPEGLVAQVDFGTLAWGTAAERQLKLTWRQFPPFTVRTEIEGPVRAEVTESKALPGRFIVTLSVDWDAAELQGTPSLRGYTLDQTLTLRWGGGGADTVRVTGALLFPALVSASPQALDLSTVRLRQRVQASLMLVSSAPVDVRIEPTPWLARVDGAGKVIDEPLRLKTNTPVRVAFAVDWAPIAERGAQSIEAGRPVRPTGRIILRWDDRTLEVPVRMIVETRA